MAGRPRSKPYPRDERVKMPTSIRIKEGLRRKIAAAANRNGDTVSQEIINRLTASFANEAPR